MTAEIHSLSVIKLNHEIEMLQECGGYLVEYAQRVGRLMKGNPDNKNLRALANRLCRNSMWLDSKWGELMAVRAALKCDVHQAGGTGIAAASPTSAAVLPFVRPTPDLVS